MIKVSYEFDDDTNVQEIIVTLERSGGRGQEYHVSRHDHYRSAWEVATLHVMLISLIDMLTVFDELKPDLSA